MASVYPDSALSAIRGPLPPPLSSATHPRMCALAQEMDAPSESLWQVWADAGLTHRRRMGKTARNLMSYLPLLGLPQG